jgi:hypothetical protein
LMTVALLTLYGSGVFAADEVTERTVPHSPALREPVLPSPLSQPVPIPFMEVE